MDTVQLEKLEESYQQVTAFYDLADKLIQSVLSSPEDQQEAHFKLVNPIVEQLEESADILTEEFIHIAKGQEAAQGSARRARIETAFRKAYMAMDDYNKQVNAMRQQALFKKMSDSVQPMVDGIKQQIERVISIFVGFIDLALDRIMQKNELDYLRKHDEKIANMLHNMALQGKTT